MANQSDSILGSSVNDFRVSWRELVVADIAYKVLGFVILAPLVGALFRVFLAISGESVLADQDILFFFLGPVGWATLIAVGAVWIAIIALEQAALMTIVYGARRSQRIRVLSALRFTGKHAWPVLQLTARLVAIALVAAAPFLALAGVVFLALLTEFDINYYLAEKPPVFWVAGALIGGILLALMIALILLLSRWVFALPLLLFENVAAPQALRTSRERTVGHRRTLVAWIVGWVAATIALSTVGTGAVGLLGRVVVPLATGSLTLLITTIGAVLVLWSVVNVIVTLLTATTFSVMLVNLYRKLGSRDPIDATQLVAEAPAGTSGVFRLSRGVVLGGAAVAVLLAALAGVTALHGVRLEDHTEVTAHRGASAAAPENTMAAVERAIADGADWVEIDVQESADGVVVVVHDSDLEKLAGVDLKIWEATAAQLRAVDIGSSFAAEFAAERVPTLDEVLQACKGRVGLNIELKYYGHDQRLEERVVELVEAREMQSNVVLMSLKRDAIKKMRALRPKWKVGLLTAVAVGDLTTLDADFLAVSINLATRGFVRSAHGRDREVYAWTVNDPITMSAMIGRGVDSIITDEPALARSVLKQRAEMSPVERLLVELAVLFGVSPKADLSIDGV